MQTEVFARITDLQNYLNQKAVDLQSYQNDLARELQNLVNTKIIEIQNAIGQQIAEIQNHLNDQILLIHNEFGNIDNFNDFSNIIHDLQEQILNQHEINSYVQEQINFILSNTPRSPSRSVHRPSKKTLNKQ